MLSGPDDFDVRYEGGKLGSPSSFREATVADDGLTLNPMRRAADENKKKKKTGDSAATAQQHWKTLQRSVSSRSAVNASNEPGLERTSSAAAGISSSNKMYLLQAREVRKNFLMFSLALVAVIVVVLAGFGTLAAEDSQLQTVQYLGSM